MYIIKNAFKSIGRSLGRNILIGIIIAIISLSACIGLSIRQAAQSAKKSTLESLSVTAQISMDIKSMMSDIKDNKNPSDGFDKDDFKDKMNSFQSLSLEELKLYATANSVDDFYYTATLNLNGSDDFEPVSADTDDSADNSKNGFADMPDIKNQNANGMGTDSDFTVIGYSSDTAMTGFINATASIEDGSCFEENTENLDCIIPTELASYNDISVGDTIILSNPNNDSESYTLTVVGTYTDLESGNDPAMGMGRGSFGKSDPTNRIYMSAAATDKIIETSKTLNSDSADSALSAEISGTYVFESAESYANFESEARELGLSENYTVSSSDLNSYEQSLIPLENLSKIAKYFLITVLLIGAVILVVFNLFNIRERKYEVGVLTAIGMKKSSVALQFLTEMLAVTVVAAAIGSAIGAVSSVPVTNALLETQVSAQQSNTDRINQSFGRGNDKIPNEDIPLNSQTDEPDRVGGMFKDFGNKAANYITQVDSATDLTVIFKLLGLTLLLTLISSAVSVVFIMRYDPLKILADRD